MKNDFYTYAYLREDGSPYYIGKGRGDRCYSKAGRRSCKPPQERSRILVLKRNLTEAEAFKHEIYMIAVFGRKDNGTGILRNLTDGGEGGSGRVGPRGFKLSEDTRRKISLAGKGKKKSQEHKRKIGEAQKGHTRNCKQFAKVWRVTYINGEEEIVRDGLPAWCESNGYSWSKIRDLSRKRCKQVGNVASVEEVEKGRWQTKGEKIRLSEPVSP